MADASPNPFAAPAAHIADVEDAEALAAGPVAADRWMRLIAALIDLAATCVVFAIAERWLPALMDTNKFSLVSFRNSFLEVALGGLVQGYWMRDGQSLGKRMIGLRVLRRDGSTCRLGWMLLVREAPWTVVSDLMPIEAAMLLLIVDSLFIFLPARRCLHDYLAGTRVVTAASSPSRPRGTRAA